MKIKQSQIITGLAFSFGLLSLFSIWNIYNWDLLGWGSKLFLFPFLAAIGFLAKLTPEQAPLYVRIQLSLLGLHMLFYLIVFRMTVLITDSKTFMNKINNLIFGQLKTTIVAEIIYSSFLSEKKFLNHLNT